jgi:DNA repair exonuclease SbcCD nuclease subunit
VKFVHAADIHLDSPMRGLDRYDGAPADNFRAATRRAMENLVALCVDEAVDFLLIVGDLYDGNWKDYKTGLFFAAQMSKLRAADVPVFLVRGNHDAESNITRTLKLPDNVHVLDAQRPETIRLPKIGVTIHGQSFGHRAVTDDLAARYPDAEPGAFNVGLLHTCLTGREGHEPYAPTSLETLKARGYEYWALGHVHAREVLSEDPWIVFPGNTQGRHAREIGEKGATLVTVEDGRVAQVEARALDGVRWAVCEVDADGAATTDELLERVRARIAEEQVVADGRTLAARVIVRGATRAHAGLCSDAERWINEVRAIGTDLGGGLWIEEVRWETRAPIDLAELAERDDAVGQLVRAVRDLRGDDTALRELAAQLQELKPKLPAELRTGPDGYDLDDPRLVVALLDDVEQLLLPRLVLRDGQP